MFDDFQNILNVSISIGEVFENLVVAFICGIIISFFYKQTYRGPTLSYSFTNSLIILCMITSVVIMVIGNNLARAFGLVGAMSIIRFRTAIKETQDIVFIFFSLSIGMASGVGLHALAIAGSIVIGILVFVLTKYNVSDASKKDFLLQFTFEGSESFEEAPFMKVFRDYCKSSRLVNTKTMMEGNLLELSYHVVLKSKKDTTAFINRLRGTKGIDQINLFFDEEYF